MTAAPAIARGQIHSLTRPNMVSVGTIVWLSSELMFFAALCSMYYLTTGFHGMHVTGGLIAFILFMIRTTMGRFTPAQATSAIVVSYYWHFVDIVWIALFSMIYFLK